MEAAACCLAGGDVDIAAKRVEQYSSYGRYLRRVISVDKDPGEPWRYVGRRGLDIGKHAATLAEMQLIISHAVKKHSR